MREQPKGEYIYDGKSYWLPIEIIQVLSKCHQEIFDWRKKWKDQRDVHSKEIDYWIMRCKKSDDAYSALAEDWKLLCNENSYLEDKLEAYEEENKRLLQEIHDLLKYED